MDTHILLELRNYLSLAHHVPGRMRIKFSPAIVTSPVIQRAAAWWQEQSRNNGTNPKGLVNYRLNIGSRSLVIEYDRKIIDHKVLDEIFSTQDQQRMGVLINQLAESFGLEPSQQEAR